MEISQEQLSNLEVELEKLKILVGRKIKRLKNEMGLSAKNDEIDPRLTI